MALQVELDQLGERQLGHGCRLTAQLGLDYVAEVG